MEQMRRPFQGVLNILRFNWHFYLLSLVFLVLLIFLAGFFPAYSQVYLYGLCFLILWMNIVSLLVSYYVYDLSGLYDFSWLKVLETDRRIINISAGFDETSHMLKNRFSAAELIVLDFYDAQKHTEVSIKRARKAYPMFEGTRQVNTTELCLEDDSADKIFVILSAHEIRDESERIIFFKALKKALKPNGQVFIIEHLRDRANFLAYNIGFFHFYSKSTWCKTFREAGLKVQCEIKQTPFISIFILQKNGDTF